MAPKVFLTGGTGYIGGSVLHAIVTAHPEYEVTVLLRNVPAEFSTKYPNVKIVKGDYDSKDVISNAAKEADIVVHNGNSDHEPSLNAQIDGLLRHYEETKKAGFLLHLSGTGIVADFQSPTYIGKLNPQVWSDLNDVPKISSLPDSAPHRNTEKILFNTIDKHGDKINIAIICPPDIYGKGLGLVKTQSVFVPLLIEASKKVDGGKLFYYGEGSNTRSWVHIEDVTRVYLGVVEAAANGGKGATWGREGYYFASTQEHSQLAVSRAAAPILAKLGVVSSPEPVQISLEKLDSLVVHPAFSNISRYLYGGNSRSKAERATKLFGYEAKKKGLLEELESDILAALGKA